MSAIEEVMMQDLGNDRKEHVSTQDFGHHNQPMTAREARIIENSRRANQFGTPEYIEANDPVKKEKRAGWIALAAKVENDGLDNLDNGQGFRRAKLIPNDTGRFANTQPSRSVHRPAPPHPAQFMQQRQPARPGISASTPATYSTPRGPKTDQLTSHNARPHGRGQEAVHTSSTGKGDLASRVRYSNGSGTQIESAPTAGNHLTNRGISRPSDDARSTPAARLADVALHTMSTPRGQQQRNSSGHAQSPANGPAGSRRASSDYRNVPTGPSGGTRRRHLPALPAIDLVAPAQWLAVSRAKIRPQQSTTASSLQPEAKSHAEPLPMPAKHSLGQPVDVETKRLPKASQDSPVLTQSPSTDPGTATATKSSAITSNAIAKQNSNLVANTAAVNSTKPMTGDGAMTKSVNKPQKTYDVATLKALSTPNLTVGRSGRPAQPPNAISEDLISISAESAPERKEAAATKEPASNGLLGLIMNNGRGGGGLAASKWA